MRRSPLAVASLVLVWSLAWRPQAATHPRSDQNSQASPAAVPVAKAPAARDTGIASQDLHRLATVGEVQIAPDGSRIAYSVQRNEGNGRSSSEIWIHRLSDNRAVRLGSDRESASGPRWSPDSTAIAFFGRRGDDVGVMVADADGDSLRFVSPAGGTNHPLPSAGERLAWSPDGRRVAFISATDGPETDDANGDPMVITRYLYKPTASEGSTRFNDNRRTHIFVADLSSSHVWIVARDGSQRRELGKIDNRQGAPQWWPDGRGVVTGVQSRGSVGLHRVTLEGKSEPVLTEVGTLGAWSVARSGAIALAFSTPDSPAELYHRPVGERGLGVRLTRLNDPLLQTRTIAPVTPFTFTSFDGTTIEAFLTHPIQRAAGARVPLIVSIHGGPHGQQGPAFTHKAQVYASRGWATLMVNYRGSTGYGQRLADAIFKDQNGGEAKDVLAGVDAALRQFAWLDAERLGIEGGSYGGQLTNWIITQTDRFKAAVPIAGISNLVSFNYMAYYHDYLAVEFGAFPHEQGLIDLLWERSPIRYARNVKTPTLFIHGENDNDVPIAEAEQFFIALQDVGVETVMVRYPREGHGIREIGHSIDAIDRSIAWYERHFGLRGGATAQPGVRPPGVRR